jgi:Lon protease-like protein
MTNGPHYHKVSDLPEYIPIFPLTGALLLPGGQLPLNIFEPRYLNMIDDALGTHRLIGMIQSTDLDVNPECPPLYSVGCLGRLSSFTETEDGRYLVTLTGVCRFKTIVELSCMTPYRQLEAYYKPYADDMKPSSDDQDFDRSELLDILQVFLDQKQLDTNWESVSQAPRDMLINSLAMTCPFSPQEKHALLEARALKDRAGILLTLLEMAVGSNTDNDDNPIQ